MPRLIGGMQGGRQLRVPRGAVTRPTGARVRKTLFDVLGPSVRKSRFLDLFAGAGGVGLEAFSRGAARVVLVERSAVAAAAIRKNVSTLMGAAGVVQVLQKECGEALAAMGRSNALFDHVFMDPPYALASYAPLLDSVASSGLLAENATVVVEHFHKREVPERISGLERNRSIKIGDHRLSFYRWSGAPAKGGHS